MIVELRKVFSDQKASANTEVKGLAALALGLILVGTGDHEAASELLAYLMDDKSPQDLKDPNYRFVALGIGLIFLGTQVGRGFGVFETFKFSIFKFLEILKTRK